MQGLAELLAAHGPAVLFPLAMVEGPVVIMTAAAFSDGFSLSLAGLWVLAVLADLAGDMLLYAIGRFAPQIAPKRLRPEGTERQLSRLFGRSGAGILLLAKWTHFAGLPTLVAAGVARMPFSAFLWWNLIGTLPKTGCLVLAGWWLGLWAIRLWDWAGLTGVALACLVLVVLLAIFFSKRRAPLWK